MRRLSKSKLLSYRQCTKRLWLEIYRPELQHESVETQASFEVGHQVGDIARQLYDPHGTGLLIDAQRDGFEAAFLQSQSALSSKLPIFEAGFRANGVHTFADIMLPQAKGRKVGWRMIEVKSATSLKEYHRDDIAIQAFVAKAAGISLHSVSLAHIDSLWVYPGKDDYQGLLVEVDLTDEAFSREGEILNWIKEAQEITEEKKEPDIRTGKHCSDPYECSLFEYCSGQEPQAKHPVNWIPRLQTKALKVLIEESGVIEMSDLPNDLLNERQLRVKTCTLSGKTYFDAPAAGAAISQHKLPSYFLDFETIQFAVPIWKGTRPYQQIPFQFSVHRLSRTGKLKHQSFLDITGCDPSETFAKALVTACGEYGPIFVYNAGFERTRIKELADRFRRLKDALLLINERIVDLLPVAQNYYYHPSQEGSWSIKKVLPAIAPDLRYDDLEGVQDGGTAMSVFMEAISSKTAPERKAQIERQLLAYCELDTFAMVRLWLFFTGRQTTFLQPSQ